MDRCLQMFTPRLDRLFLSCCLGLLTFFSPGQLSKAHREAIIIVASLGERFQYSVVVHGVLYEVYLNPVLSDQVHPISPVSVLGPLCSHGGKMQVIIWQAIHLKFFPPSAFPSGSQHFPTCFCRHGIGRSEVTELATFMPGTWAV